ncbi:nucleolar pre-ribosomal-associated protein 2 [[Candida] railenensis]|uniref:Nucleolar pre-ribosomal-associated protein 2 n=1 Tax=[Candida] railenensis TaxID=45579 RepID=A0A9P0QP87_9ASCO|nr:nucleolar pre-ribosomal-associated protein 2 [[Candida] railenensis]
MNAEGTTRFLRSKTEPLQKIVETANSLLDNDATVYLPNLKIFVFDLICDRLTDSTKSFSSWKTTPEVWQLFNRTWTLLSEDPTDRQLRNNHFKKFKFIELVITVLNNIIASDEQLLRAVFQAIDLIVQNSYVAIEESSSIELLSSYSHAISTVKGVDQDSVDLWSGTINHIYQLPYLRVNHKFNKKTTTKFYTECLIPVLNYLTSIPSSSPSAPSQTVEVFVSIVTKIVSNKDSVPYLNQNVKLLLNDEALNDRSILYFYKQVIKAHSKNMEICEELYSTITGHEKYSKLAEPLLEQLTSANRTMSTSFIQQTYEKEYILTNSSVNWDLLGHLIVLDVDLAIEHGLDILNNVPLKFYTTIGDKIVSAFVKGREFTKFIEEVWLNAIIHSPHHSKKWTNEDFINIVSKNIDELSTIQLTSVIKKLTEVYDVKVSRTHVTPRLLAIVKGLLKCSNQKIVAIKSSLLENDNSLKFIEESWEIRFYLLCLYGKDYQVKREDLVVSASKIPSCYYFYTIFRMKEINEEVADKLITTVIPKYLTYLQHESNKESNHMVLNLMKRWIAFANNNFDKEQLNQVIELIFSTVDVKDLVAYFEKYGYIFFEQKEINNALISKLIELLSNSRNKENLQLILSIPIQCFPKHLKVKLVDITYDECISKTTTNIAPTCLNHLLSQPSFRTKVETKFDALLKLLSSNGDKETLITICTSIWSVHVHSHTEPISKEYILDSLSKLSKFYKSLKVKKYKSLPIEFEISTIIVSFNYPATVDQEISDSLGWIASQYLSSSIQLLKQLSLLENYKDVNQILNALNKVPSLLNSDVHTALKDFGLKISLSPSGYELNLARSNLFSLSSMLLESNFNNATYLLSLYIAIQTEFKLESYQELLDNLVNHLQSLQESDLISIHSLLLYTMERDANEDNVHIFIQLLLCFLNKKILKKTNNKESTTLILTGSLSLILTKLDLIMHSCSGSNHSVLNILQSIKNCLSEVYWCFDQYSLETTLSLVSKIIKCVEQVPLPEKTYVLLTQVMSYILLYHRFRLSSRHHLIMSICISLLEPLSLKRKLNFPNDLSSSIESASAYSRLLGNLCEPSNKESTNSNKNGTLNSSSALIKRSLRKHLPVLLVNFIYLSLTSNFSNVNVETILSGIFKIFDVLSPIELQLVSSSLDIPGRTYYKSLYSNYKANGKWKDE